MFQQLFSATETAASFNVVSFLICTLVSLILGVLVALVYTFRNTASKSFVVTLAMLPAIVQMVIMLVNGNIGTGVAVMGAFSLIRFRSVPGSAKDIGSIFLAMAIGLATGMGYLFAAVLFAALMIAASLLLTASKLGEPKKEPKSLHITIPESLDYSGIFEDLFEKFTSRHTLVQVKTANVGSLYRLHYEIILKDPDSEKAFIDELRCRNGNLEISCGRLSSEKFEL